MKFYNLDTIISVGYRVQSHIAAKFRQWAAQHIKEYIVKGFVIDDERLKKPDLPLIIFMNSSDEFKTSEPQKSDSTKKLQIFTQQAPIMTRLWKAKRCLDNQAWLAATVIYGAILETVLLGKIIVNDVDALASCEAPKDKNGKGIPIKKWRLEQMLDVASELGWIDGSLAKYGQVLARC